MASKTIESASVHLGKNVSISETYNPSLLVAVPRLENRKQHNIDNSYLPFKGCDVWHCYEFSCLTKNGIPVTRLMKLRYNCSNAYIVESKSLKLYLNSFNMTRFGETVNECLDICKMTIEQDLKNRIKTNVEVNFIDNNAERFEIFQNFKNLMGFVDEKKLVIENFNESPELLEVEGLANSTEHYLLFDSLRSNCRVTHQPDFGNAFIYYKSSKHIKEDSLVKYLCSFRSEYHFHEECCEMIYQRLYDLLGDRSELMVATLYTRRGGIDICPVRWSRNCSMEDIDKLIDITKYSSWGINQ